MIKIKCNFIFYFFIFLIIYPLFLSPHPEEKTPATSSSKNPSLHPPLNMPLHKWVLIKPKTTEVQANQEPYFSSKFKVHTSNTIKKIEASKSNSSLVTTPFIAPTRSKKSYSGKKKQEELINQLFTLTDLYTCYYALDHFGELVSCTEEQGLSSLYDFFKNTYKELLYEHKIKIISQEE